MGYKETGVISTNDLKLPSKEQLEKGVAIIECIEPIPCNPCVEACPSGAITMKDLNDPPNIDYDRCTGCGKCIAVCPGLAIFVVKVRDTDALISIPYEFLPIPREGEKVLVLDREGNVKGKGLVIRVGKFGKTHVITVKTDRENALVVRNIMVER